MTENEDRKKEGEKKKGKKQLKMDKCTAPTSAEYANKKGSGEPCDESLAGE